MAALAAAEKSLQEAIVEWKEAMQNWEDVRDNKKYPSVTKIFESYMDSSRAHVEECQKAILDLNQLAAHWRLRVFSISGNANLPTFPSFDEETSSSFKTKLVEAYNRAAHTDPETLRATRINCMVLNKPFDSRDVVAVHIIPLSKSHIVCHFRLPLESVNHFRNGLLLYKTIKTAFNKGRCAFLYNPLSQKLEFRVLDSSLLREPIFPPASSQGSGPATSTFQQINGSVLQHPPRCRPYLRLLHQHAVLSINANSSDPLVTLSSTTLRAYLTLSPVMSDYESDIDGDFAIYSETYSQLLVEDDAPVQVQARSGRKKNKNRRKKKQANAKASSSTAPAPAAWNLDFSRKKPPMQPKVD